MKCCVTKSWQGGSYALTRGANDRRLVSKCATQSDLALVIQSDDLTVKITRDKSAPFLPILLKRREKGAIPTSLRTA